MLAPPARVPVPRLAYSIPEAAEAVSVSENHLRNLVNSGQVRTVSLGRSRRIPLDEIQRLAGLNSAIESQADAAITAALDERERQGLPRHIDDDTVLRAVARLVAPWRGEA